MVLHLFRTHLPGRTDGEALCGTHARGGPRLSAEPDDVTCRICRWRADLDPRTAYRKLLFGAWLLNARMRNHANGGAFYMWPRPSDGFGLWPSDVDPADHDGMVANKTR